MGDFHSLRGASRSEIKHAAATAAALSALFVIAYGACNTITSQRSDVGTLFFQWERYIPFVPLMIIPYMSIDLFFVGAPFLCDGKNERIVLSKRIAFAIIVACAFFLLMPLRFAFPRPQASGWLGGIFSFLHGFDQPYNLFPSLHITLRTILADTYTRHSKGWLRWFLHFWFSLIGFSTVLTYQHHVMDVVGGFILAIVCFYLFRDTSEYSVATNQRIGFYYSAGAIISVFAAMVLWPWGSLFLWPAVSLSLVALAYFGFISQVYRKEKGRLPLATRLLLAPCLLGHQVSLLHYSRRCRPWDEVAPGVRLGRKLTDSEAAQAVGEGVTAVLDLTSEFSEAEPFRAVRYLNIPLLDLTAPTQEQLAMAVDFIRRERREGIVYVHCKIGYSRSATVVGAYLIVLGRAKTTEEAISLMRKARPSLIVRPEAANVLKEFERGFSTQDAQGVMGPSQLINAKELQLDAPSA